MRKAFVIVLSAMVFAFFMVDNAQSESFLTMDLSAAQISNGVDIHVFKRAENGEWDINYGFPYSTLRLFFPYLESKSAFLGPFIASRTPKGVRKISGFISNGVTVVENGDKRSAKVLFSFFDLEPGEYFLTSQAFNLLSYRVNVIMRSDYSYPIFFYVDAKGKLHSKIEHPCGINHK